MNDARRKDLSAIKADLESLLSRLEDLAAAEQEAHDTLPDSLTGTDREERMQANVEALEEAAADLENVLNTLEDVQ